MASLPDHLLVAAVLEGVHDLLADALVLQGRPGALEAEVHVLALLAYERREGGGQPATPADGAAHTGECLEASAAEHVARPPLAADAALGVEQVGERSEVGFVRYQASAVVSGFATGAARSKPGPVVPITLST